MFHTDQALLVDLIRAAHDPDPIRAARYRPFAYSAAGFRADGVPAVTIPPRRVPSATRSLLRTLIAVVPTLISAHRPQPVPCCAAACC